MTRLRKWALVVAATGALLATGAATPAFAATDTFIGNGIAQDRSSAVDAGIADAVRKAALKGFLSYQCVVTDRQWDFIQGSGLVMATVTVLCDNALARVPNVHAMTASRAQATLTSAHFRTSVNSRVDDRCESIGLVMGQSPSAGSVLRQESTVSIFIGVLPSHPCS